MVDTKENYLVLHLNEPNMSPLTLEQMENLQVTILEGDHTQNPPSYFEGLKSVGQSASEDTIDEIVVSSVNEREYIDGSIVNNVWHFNKPISSGYFLNTSDKIIGLSIINNDNVWIGSKNINPNECFDVSNKLNYGEKVSQILFSSDAGWTFTPNPNLTNYIIFNKDMKQDKKRLLYYNEETQSWEKPVLRQWDSIEKHADGKYYYHQRSGEVVLNGSENWVLMNDFASKIYATPLIGAKDLLICDKVQVRKYSASAENYWALYYNLNYLRLQCPYVTTDEFKQWLQANNVTVVYQLAQEKVYECTNIDLITYSGETNFIVESGAISPRTTLKVHNNISNVVSLLQKKVSLLENKFIQGLKQVLAGDMYSLAELLYPEDFVEENPENGIMLLPFE